MLVGHDGAIDFERWAQEFRRALDLGEATDVPCDGCTACCRSAQFVHIGSDETATLRRIDPALLAPAPGRPGYLVMGYDQHGRCPMLGDQGCGIYHDRPRTCRTYDCRVFAATDVGPEQPLVAGRIRDWAFRDDLTREAAVGRAAELLAAGAAPVEAAVRAVVETAAPALRSPTGRR